MYGFKPTAHLISTEGLLNIMPGNDSIAGSLGPFTRSKRDIDLVLSAYSAAAPWNDDPALVRYKFESITPSEAQPLQVGVMLHDGIKEIEPAVKAVLEEAIRKLSNSSRVDLVPFKPFKHAESWNILSSLYFEGCGKKMRDLIESSGEPLLPLTEWILQATSNEATVNEVQNLRVVRDNYRQAYSDHWNSFNVDVVLSPVASGTAPVHGTSKYWNYTAVWNLLDYPSLSFPASDILRTSASNDTSDYPGIVAVTNGHAQGWNGEPSLPIGLQLTGKRWQDNEVLSALTVVEEILIGEVRARN